MTAPKYTPLIGLEIHVQLNTQTKLFCGCPRKSLINNNKEEEPNTNICPICLGLPGAMPYLNKNAVEKAIKIGLGLHSTPNNLSVWDRKNYTYPDLFVGYQISQLDYPLNLGGYIDISNKRININRAHLENNAAKSMHMNDNTYIDGNKSGTPLVEIVSEPELRNAEEAREYAEKIRETVRWVDSSDADMYLGEMKFDINISLCVEGDPDKDGLKNIKHTPIVEVKNRNSFKELCDVINYEIKRQTEEYDKTHTLYTKGSKVTMGWDEQSGKTFFQREKEESDDYRYFHEPDVPPVVITSEWIENIKKTMPEPIDQVIDKIAQENNADRRTVSFLVGDREKYTFFQACITTNPVYTKNYINWIASDLSGILSVLSIDFDQIALEPKTLVDIITNVSENKISQAVGKEILKECIETNTNPNIAQYIQEKGLGKVSDTDAIKSLVEKAINENPKVVEDIKKGKESAKMAIVGSVMRESKGKADVTVVKELIDSILQS